MLLGVFCQQWANGQDLTAWQTVKGLHIAWRYGWDAAWGDYDVQVRNDYDYGVTLKFFVICGKSRITAFWSLKPGGSTRFIQRYDNGGPGVPLTLEVAELDRDSS